jgi:hypothetical protein
MTSRPQKAPAKPDAIALLAAMQPQAPHQPEIGGAPPASIQHKPRLAKPGARAGTRQIAGHFPEATWRALKHLIAEENTTLQALLEEAIEDLLIKKGRTKLRHA